MGKNIAMVIICVFICFCGACKSGETAIQKDTAATEPEVTIQNGIEFIVKLDGKITIEEIIAPLSKYELSVKKILSNRSHIYLLHSPKGNINTSKVLRLLKEQQGVIEAQLNNNQIELRK